MAASTNQASTSAGRHLHAWYDLEPKTIGGRAYAEVYRATHRLTGCDVAVKIFHANLGVEEGAEREIRIMRLLRHHPHVIRFYEAAVVVANGGDQTCIVMELAESGEIYKELYNQVISSQHGLDETEVRRMFMQLVSGVAYCHRNMVVHHDLKLENVLLDAGKNVKLADFGFSDFFGPVQKPAADCGSLLYAAPEVCAGRTDTTRHLGPEVDMWSCGVILFALLCGYLPFDGPDEHAIKRRITSGRVRIPSGISDEPRALISGMLQVCPERRLSIDEVRHHPWLQHSIPRYLAMPPPLHAAGQIFKICDRTVEQVVRMMVGLDNDNLVEFLHRGVENQATVAYYLMLDNRFDAPTRYMWLLHEPPMANIISVDLANTESDSIPNEVVSTTATEESLN